MQSVRKGLRKGSLDKDTYERLTCSDCGKVLKTKDDPEGVGTIRTCPECGGEWRELS